MALASLITGTNSGNVSRNIETARKAIERSVGTIVKASSVMWSEPWGTFNDPAPAPFLNQVLIADTPLTPAQLLEAVSRIEKEMGRKRAAPDVKATNNRDRKYDSRIIDIDILFYDDTIMSTEQLVLPHPRIGERMFVLEPLAEVMPDYIHPVTGETISRMLEKLKANIFSTT